MNAPSLDRTPEPLAKSVPLLGSEEQILSVAREFADSIRPGAALRDAKRLRPWDEIGRLRRSGLLGITIPAEFGGPAASIRTLVEVFRVISAADSSIGQIPQNHFSHLESLRVLGTPEQKRFFYAEVQQGALFGNALSERGGKGGMRNFGTRLQRTSGGWILNGRKYYTTGALFAQWLPVTALDENDRSQMALVPRNANGVQILDDWESMGQRGTASGTAILEQVFVPEEHVVPLWLHGERPSTRLAFGQIMHVAIDVGITEEALADTVSYVRKHSRPWHGTDLERASDDPHTIHRIGELTVQTEAARALLFHAADSFDAVLKLPLEQESTLRLAILVAAAKAAASAVCVQVSSDLFALAGTSAADEKWNLHRHWRNARTHTLHDPEVWKYHYIGDWVLNGRAPPRQALIV